MIEGYFAENSGRLQMPVVGKDGRDAVSIRWSGPVGVGVDSVEGRMRQLDFAARLGKGAEERHQEVVDYDAVLRSACRLE